MKKKKELKSADIEIKAIAHKGMALGKTSEGMVVLTKNAVPGDHVEVRLHKKRKGVWLGLFTKIISPSPHRVAPLCQHFSVCGGCSWQDLKYEEQLHQKETIVRDAIQRIAKIDASVIEPIVGAKDTFYYRNKLEYTFSTYKWKIEKDEDISSPQNALGFHRPESFFKIVDIEKCHLQIDISNQIRNTIKQLAAAEDLSFYDIKNHTGLLRNLIIRTNSSGDVMLSLIIGSNTEEKVINLLSQIQEKFSNIKSIFVGFNQKRNDSLFEVNFKNIYGENYLIETLNHVKFYISPKSFFQTNTKQAELLYSLVEDFAQLKGTETIYDLYCGVGSIGIYLAKNAKTIIGVEEIEDAILDARKNASLNQLENTHFYTGDAKLIVNESLFEKHGEADLIIVDPPRAGLHEDLIKTLLNIAAKKIIYVSCNPATQARDLLLLCEKYDVTRTKPVDMFPHTNHVECIAALELKS